MKSSNQHLNQNPEQVARDTIDKMLKAAGWVVQSKNEVNLAAGMGVAVREYLTDVGPADYVLFVDRKPVGIIEAKREEEGFRLTTVEDQSSEYARAKLKYLDNDPLPFVYESTGSLTRFSDYRDPRPRGRIVFGFHKPATMAGWLRQEKTLRGRLLDMPVLQTDGLRPAQIRAINNLEHSFKKNRPRALIQMATGAGKTFTASTFVYRLLKHADAKRVLFLVDTRNLGEQAEQEFMKYQPRDDNRKFTELYNVQRLSSNYIATDSQVCISTIQRLYSILKGEELDDSAELENPNESTWLENQIKTKEPMPVVYNEKVPLEMFDFIVIDECHRSIYNLWKQVLDYFDAFLIGLTATPDKRTFGFFNENVVSEYTYEESVADGVNVPYDVYTIETEISKAGDTIQAGWYLDRRDKLTRKKRWQREDEDLTYLKNDLDKRVVNPSQIRHIIREYKAALKRDIFPKRFNADREYEVPKTLIFAKTDSHADDIITIVREEFDEGNDFCKKVTYKASDDPKSVLARFRNDHNPRIVVTVDMIATGTDVKPLEVLLFMRDVRSVNYFEQMKGRGTRTIPSDDLKRVTSTANSKTHFVIVDAIGATKSKKTDSRPLERKRSVPMKDLLGAVTMGASDEDLFLSLANRLIRLEKQITQPEAERVVEYSNGKNLKQMTRSLLDAWDPDTIENRVAEKLTSTPLSELMNLSELDDEQIHDLEQFLESIKNSESKPGQDGHSKPGLASLTEEQLSGKRKKLIEDCQKKVQEELILAAASVFNGKLNDYLENVRRKHEQIIDSMNLDQVTRSEWDVTSIEKSKEIIGDFSEYLLKHKEEIAALSIFYNQPYRRREITFKMIKEVLEKLKANKPQLAPEYVWDAWSTLDAQGEFVIEPSEKPVIKTYTPLPACPKSELVALVSLIRKACGIDKVLTPFEKKIDENFKNWIFKKNAGKHNQFSEEQMNWLRLLKDHVASSFHIDVEDLDYTPFDSQGGRGKMWQLLGEDMEGIIEELNEVLAA